MIEYLIELRVGGFAPIGMMRCRFGFKLFEGRTKNVLPYYAFRSDGGLRGGALLGAEVTEGEMGRFGIRGARFSALRILLAEYSAVGRIRRLEL